MSVSVLAAALLVTGAAPNHGLDDPGMGTIVPVYLMASSTGEQTDPATGGPVFAPPPLVATLPPGQRHDPVVGGEEIVVSARKAPPPGDPFQNVNAKSFEITQAVDRAIVRPVALTYQRIVPDPLRSGFRNFLNNLREPVTFLNFMLQLKPGKAIETVGRFAINSTIGVAGFFDMAKRKPFKLPRRKNGLGNTLGFYGVGPGPFFFLPIFGPTNLRDLFGDNIDRLVLPAVVGKPFNKPLYAITIGALSSLDQRAEFDEKLEEIHKGSADPYAKTREDYLASRRAAIEELHGRRYVPPPKVERTLPAILP